MFQFFRYLGTIIDTYYLIITQSQYTHEHQLQYMNINDNNITSFKATLGLVVDPSSY